MSRKLKPQSKKPYSPHDPDEDGDDDSVPGGHNEYMEHGFQMGGDGFGMSHGAGRNCHAMAQRHGCVTHGMFASHGCGDSLSGGHHSGKHGCGPMRR